MFIRFVFGLLLGSFLNVVALRYREDKFVFNPKVIGGRSSCPHCKKNLQWFELVPLFSFFLQEAKCRSCRKPISWLYPLGELLSGLVFALVPLHVPGGAGWIWVAVFEIFLLICIIDFRLHIIPDELTIFLAALGLFLVLGNWSTDFIGTYRFLFGLQDGVWLNHLFGAAILGAFFSAIVLLTRGKGMGWGDVKLSLALGFLFGWPGGMMLAATSFVLGGASGIALILLGKKNRKSTLPFGPFLGLGAVIIFFFGDKLLSFYFGYLVSLGAKFLG